MWLTGLSADLQTDGSLVRFPVRAHVWVVGQVPSRGCMRGNHTLNIKAHIALDGIVQWIEHGPVNQRVAGSIPSQGTCLGCGPDPQLGACKRQAIYVSLPLYLPPFL